MTLGFKKLAFAAGIAIASLLSAQSASAVQVFEWSGDGKDILVNSVDPGSITVINEHPAWGDVSDDAGLASGTAKWISYDDTGQPRTVTAPNASSRTIGDETAHFRRTFSTGAAGDFNLWILADDTATVTLTDSSNNVTTIETAFLGQLDPCAPGGSGIPIGCVEDDMGIYALNLAKDTYTLDVYAFQTGGSPFGVQYAFAYAVPEPATWIMMILGFGLVAVRLQKKRQALAAA